MYDNILSDFLKSDLDKSDSERIQRAIDATENGILYIPKGDYSIKTPILIKNRCSLKMHPAARLVAEQEMDFVLTYKPDGAYHKLTMFNADGSVYDNLGLFIEGGDIDAQFDKMVDDMYSKYNMAEQEKLAQQYYEEYIK